MPLDKVTLQKVIYDGFYRIFTSQASKATNGDEKEDPDVVIKDITNEMATVLTNAVDTFVRSGDINVGATNIQVTSTTPGTLAAVTPLIPAKII